ncbi:MAG: tetratricopeptide repeat protein [Gemmatimonadetes bacterium]|nr:tetratricopeptide repeat protein [Gemmatimonadota bacterium]
MSDGTRCARATFMVEGATQVRRDLAAQPLLQARLLHLLGRAWADLGDYPAAEQLYNEALAIRRRVLAPGATDIAATELSLGTVAWQAGRAATAESTLRRVLPLLARDTAGRKDRVRALTTLANSVRTQGRLAEAEPIYREALALAREVHPDDDVEVADRLSDLGSLLGNLARFAEGESLLVAAIEMARADLGSQHPRVAGPMNNLATQLMVQRKFAPAETLLREITAIVEAALPDPHPLLAVTLSNLGANLYEQQRPAEAEPIQQRALAMRRATLDPSHPSIGITQLNIASTVEALGRPGEALRMKRDAVAFFRRTVGPGHPLVGDALNATAATLINMKRYREALVEYAAAVQVRTAALGPNHPSTAASYGGMARSYAELGKRPEAVTHYEKALAALAATHRAHRSCGTGRSTGSPRCIARSGRGRRPLRGSQTTACAPARPRGRAASIATTGTRPGDGPRASRPRCGRHSGDGKHPRRRVVRAHVVIVTAAHLCRVGPAARRRRPEHDNELQARPAGQGSHRAGQRTGGGRTGDPRASGLVGHADQRRNGEAGSSRGAGTVVGDAIACLGNLAQVDHRRRGDQGQREVDRRVIVIDVGRHPPCIALIGGIRAGERLGQRVEHLAIRACIIYRADRDRDGQSPGRHVERHLAW